MVKVCQATKNSLTVCAVQLHKAYVLLNNFHDFLVCLGTN